MSLAGQVGALRPLVCMGCGANLDRDEQRAALARGAAGGGELECDYCGKIHVYEHPPAAGVNEYLTAGQPVLVEWGGRWWPARVMVGRGPMRWKIHFEGWADSLDEIVGVERIRPRPVAPRASSDSGFVGLMVGIIVATGVALAVVIIALGAAINANEAGTSPQPSPPPAPMASSTAPSAPRGASAKPELPGPIGRPGETTVGPDTPLELGQSIHVRWRGDWYQAEVATLNDDGSVAVDYVGWPKRYDQGQVRRGRLRLP